MQMQGNTHQILLVDLIEQTNPSAIDKQRRNASYLVCCSPPEVLQYVFDIYVNDEHKMHHQDRDPKAVLPPTALLSHVCARWRALCLDDKHLWAKITIDHHRGRWPPEFIARSGNSPLEVAFGISKKYGLEVALAVVHNMHRVCSLDARGSSEHLQPFCDALTGTAAPILEYLCLGHFPNPAMYGTAVYVPSNIFAGTAPKLRSISLANVFPQGPPVQAFAHLTDVHMDGALTATTAQPFLQSAPDLKVMICWKFSTHPDANTYLPMVPSSLEGKRVDAAQMTCLAIDDDDMAQIVQLLEDVNAPSLSQIGLFNMCLTHPDLEHFTLALPLALSFHIKALRRIHGSCRELAMDSSSITCWPSQSNLVRHDLIDDADDVFPFYAQWDYDDDSFPEEVAPFVDGMLGVLPVDEVRTLSLRYITRNWGSLYRASNVTVLNYTCESPDADVLRFLQAMVPLDQRIDVAGTALDDRTLFPQLARIVFKNMMISTDSGNLVRVLQRLSRARQNDGIALEVAFEGCSGQENITTGLEDMSVTWDGA
ncbi:hypothetical protein EVG20_g3930 [Dentipellis fragilis]|uniref:Uncharacterized protein n=1 Tax=Dentipellis fragilis TaxID=205917 RepID=A0A4Y9YYM5_9AGAM|nr:hypothetical protein EVG20_g3930 [Dentipellis fragilis]